MDPKRATVVIALLLACCLVTAAGVFTPAVAASINASVGVTDGGAPTSFTFGFTAPIVGSLNAPVQATLSITASLTDAAGNGVSMTPFLFPTLTEGRLETAFVLGVGSGFSVSDADSDPGETTTFNASSTVLFSGGAPPYDSMELDLSFTASGDGDSYAVTLTFEVVPPGRVPEPSTSMVIAAGALVLATHACWSRRRLAVLVRR